MTQSDSMEADLTQAMHKETCSKGDWNGLRKWWNEAYQDALGGEKWELKGDME